MTCPNLSLPAPCPPAYPNKNHTVVARCAGHPPNRLFLGRNLFHNDSWGSKEEKYKAGHSLENLVVKKGILAMHTLQLRNLDSKENPYVSVPPILWVIVYSPEQKCRTPNSGPILVGFRWSWCSREVEGRAHVNTWWRQGEANIPGWAKIVCVGVCLFVCVCSVFVWRKGTTMMYQRPECNVRHHIVCRSKLQVLTNTNTNLTRTSASG